MIKIGLSGGIASGKSTVAKMFVKLGVTLIDADQLARQVVAPGSFGLQELVNLFGLKILNNNKELNREELRKIIFYDSVIRRRVDSIIHPKIEELIIRRVNFIENNNPNTIILLDIPLLFEKGWAQYFSINFLVWCTPEEQIKRIMLRDNLNEKEAQVALRAQMPIDQKLKIANFIIDNSLNLAETQRQVWKIWGRFT